MSVSGPDIYSGTGSEDILPGWLNWLVRRIGRGTLLTFALLLVIIACLNATLMDVVRELDVAQIWGASILALMTGWILGRTSWRIFPALTVALLLGLAFIGLRTGHLFDEIWHLVTTFNGLAAGWLRWGPGLPLPDTLPTWTALAEITSALGVLASRSFTWVFTFLAGSPAFDPVASQLVWGFVVWVVSAWAGWSTRRWDSPLLATAPPAAMIGIILAATNAGWGVLIPTLGAALTLMGAYAYQSQERGWERTQVDFSEELRFEVALTLAAVVVLLVGAAAISPYISIRSVQQFFNQIAHQSDEDREEAVRNSLGLEERPKPTRPAPPGLKGGPVGGSGSSGAPQSSGIIQGLHSPGLPRNHLIGTGPELSEKVVMLIATGDLPAGPPDMLNNVSIPRYYWRSLTYDIYTGHGWSTSSINTARYDSSQTAWLPQLAASRPLTQTVQAVEDLGGLVYAAGDPVRVDQPYQMDWRTLPTNSNPDLFGASLTQPNSNFIVFSQYSHPSQADLKAAGSSYPPGLLEHYTRLPRSFPSQTTSLALELTATQPTPYDRARAIERYLRENYTYNLDLPAPPSSEDVVYYFLFDLKQGYCDYYASAMVVLARAAGLPARLAVGYAPGTYDSYQAQYILTEADAHSWPEIYFPGYGWVNFEPTSGIAALERPLDKPEGLPQVRLAPDTLERLAQLDWDAIFFQASRVILIALLAALIWSLSEPYRLTLLKPAAVLPAIYDRIRRRAAFTGLSLEPGQTPAEYAAAFSNSMELFQGSISLLNEAITPASAEVGRIVLLYTRSIYSPHPPLTREKKEALRIWSRLRWRLMVIRMARRWETG